MGYTTKFDGIFHLDKPLFDSEVLYLLAFAGSRRVKRDVKVLQNVPDSARVAVNLPPGEEGCYFVNEKWTNPDLDESIIDYNRPPTGQPGLWCQWIPTYNGRGIQWDGGEKFYKYVEWLQYIVNHFLVAWGYVLNGTVHWQGELPDDIGKITVENNKIICPEGAELMLKEAVSPVPVPLNVWQGLEAVKAAGTPLMLWYRVIDQATALGYPETAKWVESHIEKYVDGLERGFEADGRVLESGEVVF